MDSRINKNGSGWYLFKANVGLLFSFLLLYPAIPKLVLIFIDYPALEQAKVIEGRLHVKQSPYRNGGRRSQGGMPDPQNFVIDKQGVSHKIFWRIKGDGYGSFVKNYEGLKVKVWFNPWYGVIQGEYEKTPEINEKFAKMFPQEKWGKAVDNPENSSLFKTKFDEKYNRDNALRTIMEFKMVEYNWAFLIFISIFIYTIYCFRKSFKIRKCDKGATLGVP